MNLTIQSISPDAALLFPDGIPPDFVGIVRWTFQDAEGVTHSGLAPSARAARYQAARFGSAGEKD
jgi:hypothetical protein